MPSANEIAAAPVVDPWGEFLAEVTRRTAKGLAVAHLYRRRLGKWVRLAECQSANEVASHARRCAGQYWLKYQDTETGQWRGSFRFEIGPPSK